MEPKLTSLGDNIDQLIFVIDLGSVVHSGHWPYRLPVNQIVLFSDYSNFIPITVKVSNVFVHLHDHVIHLGAKLLWVEEKIEDNPVQIFLNRMRRGKTFVDRILSYASVNSIDLRRIHVISDSASVRKYCERENLHFKDIYDFRSSFLDLSDEEQRLDKKILAAHSEYLNLLNVNLFASSFVSVSILLFIFLVTRYFEEIRYFLSGFIYPLIPLAGFLFFYWRQRYRLSYGLAEVIGGATIPIYTILQKNLLEQSLESTDYIQILAGLYVIVRGLDNTEKGLEGTRYEQGWKRWFDPRKL